MTDRNISDMFYKLSKIMNRQMWQQWNKWYIHPRKVHDAKIRPPLTVTLYALPVLLELSVICLFCTGKHCTVLLHVHYISNTRTMKTSTSPSQHILYIVNVFLKILTKPTFIFFIQHSPIDLCDRYCACRIVRTEIWILVTGYKVRFHPIIGREGVLGRVEVQLYYFCWASAH